ncbi:MAG: hypothetical protein HFJ06_14380 [Lachnospiraceae bacterium]|nr:hypothetical protein [Lachnospiraceae bacterium]
MIQFNHFKRLFFYISIIILIFFTVFISSGQTVHAMKVAHYSYDKIYKALPAKYQKEEFIYTYNGIPFISFATYNGSSDYKTSLKKSSNTNNFLYCVDFSKHMVFDKNFSEKNKLFNNELRARIGIALHLGTTKWGKKADASFTNGNAMLDYYMTQLVIHSLIYKYGGEKSNYGIQFSLLKFKSGTDSLYKKCKKLYEHCCNAKITLKNGNFQTAEFSFNKPVSNQLYLDGDYLTSPMITCQTNKNNASVQEYKRTVTLNGNNSVPCRIEQSSDSYDSQFQIKLPLDSIEDLSPGEHRININEYAIFKKEIAGFWNCSDKELTNTNQEIGGLIYINDEALDNCGFEFLIGEVFLHKKDSINGSVIADAAFQILQYDDSTGQYTYYKDLNYNPENKCYESGNLYLKTNNKKGKFKIIESKPGKYYINDWAGQEFQITKERYIYEFNVENQPILGKLHIYKNGENPAFTGSVFQQTEKVSLKDIKFTLYAAEDIYFKGSLFYKKDQKIVDLITDEEGEAHADNLIEGRYYLKESENREIHLLNPETFSFSITRDNYNKYNEVTYQLTNILKKCQLQVFKYYFDAKDEEQKNKKPLSGAKFGLYARNDILDCNGSIIVKKDTLIEEQYSGKDGKVLFENMLYSDYYIKELEAPDGFILNDGIVEIKKEDFSLSKEGSNIYLAYKEIVNQEQLFKIKLTKYGETFSGFNKENSENGEYISYLYDKKPLENVQFSIYDENSNLLMSAITDQNGLACFDNVKQGEYYCIEDFCPAEYSKASDQKKITCVSDNNIISEPPAIEESFYNELCGCSLSIHKLGEQAVIGKKGITYKKVPLEGIIFGIYQDFDYTFASGESVAKGSCIGYMITDSKGNAEFKGKIPEGNYYIKELKTNAEYAIDLECHSFTVTPKSNQEIKIKCSEIPLLNKLLKASVRIIKTDANTNKALKDVEFTLYNDKKQKVGVYKTDKKGKILVEGLPYGSYYFVETKCKNGYYSTNNRYKFTLESEDTITLNITNTPILKLGFEEHYKSGLVGILLIIFLMITMYIFIPGRKIRKK